MRGLWSIRILLLATAAASLGWGQSISGLQASMIEGYPADVTGITSGTDVGGGGFVLYVNGTFSPGSFLNLQWLNTATNVTTTFTVNDAYVTPTQIVVTIPNSLFATIVASPVPVRVTVTQATGSAFAFFAINPPLSAVQPFLPAGTVNVPYTARYYTGGTAPYDAGGNLDSYGLYSGPNEVSGTPTTAFTATVNTFAVDFWGNEVTGATFLEVVNVPTISQITPGSSAAGAGNLTLTVDGANFVSAIVSGNQTLPGSQVQWKVNAVVTPLVTTFVNSGRLTAVAPSALLAAPVSAVITVQQPSSASSAGVPFAVLAPTISSIGPSGVPAGSNTTTLTVNGANFTLNGNTLPTVTLNGIALSTIFVNSGQLSASVPAGQLITPGTYNVQVINPGGAPSNSVSFAVLRPVLSNIAPATVPVGSAAFTITVSGVNFLTGSQIVFNGTALTTVAGANLTATVPAGSLGSAGSFPVTVANPGGALATAVSFVVASPTISAISPTLVSAGAATFTLTVTGTNFVSGAQVLMNGVALTTTFVNASTLTATVLNSFVAAPKVAAISVANPGQSGNITQSLPLTVAASLSIATTSLPSGVAGNLYSATMVGRGGTQPYTWSASGFPPGLFIDPATGVISGALQVGGTFVINVVLQDAARSVVTTQLTLQVNPPPVTISVSGGLPAGTVGVVYSGFVSPTGGSSPYSISLGGGALPGGLNLAASGAVTGTPTAPGFFSFAVNVTDANGVSGSGSLSIRINPAPLTVSPLTPPPIVTGAPTTIAFTVSGGTPPYRFTPCSAPPPGLTFANGALSGTPATVGTFAFCITIGDAADATATKTITVTVTDAPVKLSLGGIALADGKVGVEYSGQITAAGGAGPYTYLGSGLPTGLALSSSGAISGTPATDGQFSFSATVTDSKGATATGTFSIKIVPADLTVVTASLPDGTVSVAYLVNLIASGGTKPYTWTLTGLPDGLTATSAGVISGIPKTAGKFSVTVGLQDAAGIAIARHIALSLTIQPAPLVIITATAPNGMAGAPYSVAVTVTGGTAPFTYSATGLPAGVTLSNAGVISGTPVTPGTSTIVVTVKDAAGVTVTRSFTLTVGLPSAPPLNFAGVGDTSSPLQQPRLQVSLGNSFPVDVVVTLTLTFAPDSGPDDPSIQFAGGGRTARITIPAGAANGATDVALQTGSVAGLITITAQMQASGEDITPSPAPRRTVRITAAAPVIVAGSLTAVRNATGFTVTLSGYVTDREMTQAIFVFTPAAGSNLQTTTLTLNIDTVFAQYFSGSGAAATGSQFTFTQPFVVTGSTQAIASVTVTLVNRIGQSAAVTATLN